MKVTEQIKKINDYTEELKKDLILKLEKIKDNTKIKRLGERVFTISSKDLGSSWSPIYYDNLQQVEALKEIITNCKSIETLKNMLTTIVETGKCNDTKHAHMRFNDDVREYIKELL